MNFELAREVYGIGVWSVDSKTLPAMLQILSNSKNGQNLEIPEKKYNSVSILNIKSDDLEDYEEYEDYEPTNEDILGIALVNLDGAITVGGGMSSCGMTELSERILDLNKNDNVKGFIIYTNSGGGSTMAVEIMTDCIKEVRKTKPVFGLVKKGGMAASAAYAILSSCEEIYAESEMSTVGSCGTMVQFEGRAANTEDGEGEKYIRLYATKSVKKNKGIEEALNNNNYSIIIDDMLNPVNERFLNLVETNRKVLKGTDFDNGHDAYAKDSIGKFVDGIATKSEVIKKVLSKTQINTKSKNNNSNSSKMTKEQIKSEHPESYNEIVGIGQSSERERVNSWLVYSEADSKAVSEGIKSGLEISPSQREGFFAKMQSATMLKNLTADSAKPLVTSESAIGEAEAIAKTESEKEVEAAFDFKL